MVRHKHISVTDPLLQGVKVGWRTQAGHRQILVNTLIFSLMVGLIVSITFAVTLGPVPIEFTRVWRIALSNIPWLGGGVTVDWSLAERNIVWQIRFPRVLLAAVVGAGRTLSGGEKQRALIARALAQQVRFLVLDEPTNHLDIHYQLLIMDIVKSLNVTVFAALHDLNVASAYCDRIYMIKSGQIVAAGTPVEVFHPDLIRDVFEVECEVSIHPVTGRPNLVFFLAKERSISR